MRVFIFAILTLMCFSINAQAITYSGSLSSSPSVGIDCNGQWLNEGVTTIDWSITSNTDGTWGYQYTMTVPESANDISHLIIETAAGFDDDNMLSWTHNYSYATHPGLSAENPGMPEDMSGLKFDNLFGYSVTIYFAAWAEPVWGDFYAKGDTLGNEAWNLGFTGLDTDPTAAAGNGSLNNHILVPGPIPEPATLMLLGLGALVMRRRR